MNYQKLGKCAMIMILGFEFVQEYIEELLDQRILDVNDVKAIEQFREIQYRDIKQSEWGTKMNIIGSVGYGYHSDQVLRFVTIVVKKDAGEG